MPSSASPSLHRCISSSLIAVFSLLFFLPVIAQAERSEKPEISLPSLEFEPLVVTSRKREESSTKIPLSVSVFSDADIESSRYGHIGNIGDFTPALTYIDPSNPSQTAFIIRGVFSAHDFGEYAAAMFVDGVYQGADSMYARDLFDIERIEIMKGPQTSLYGKSSIGGAISVITHDPKDYFEFKSKTSAGTQDRFQQSATLNLPVAPGVFAVRASWNHSSSDGFLTNAFNGVPLDDDEQNSFRFKTKYTPSSRLKIVTSLSYRERNQGSWYFHKVSGIEDYEGQPYDIDQDTHTPLDAKAFSVTVDYELWGDYEFTSITAWDKASEVRLIDLDMSSQGPSAADPFANIASSSDHVRESFSQEIRLSSPSEGKLRWIVGAYAFEMEDDFHQHLDFNTLIPMPPLPPADTVSDSNTYSLFGQLIAKPAENWELSFEGRYDYDERKQIDQWSPQYPQGLGFDAFSPKIALSYHWTPATTLYSSWVMGHKAGGINHGNFPIFGGERSKVFEAGIKAFSPEQKVSLNFAYFMNYLDGQQKTEFDIATASDFVTNKGEGRIQGVELDMAFKASEQFLFDLSFMVIDNTFTDYKAFLVGPTGEAKMWDLSGNKEPYVTDYEISAGVQYLKQLGERSSFSARLDVRAAGEKYFEVFNIVKHKPFQLANLNLSYQWERWVLGAYIDNLFNEAYFTLYLPQYRFPFPYSDVGVNSNARSAGLSLKFTY